MTHQRTDEEKIQLVKDLIKNAYDEMERIHDEAMNKVEEEWLREGWIKKEDLIDTRKE